MEITGEWLLANNYKTFNKQETIFTKILYSEKYKIVIVINFNIGKMYSTYQLKHNPQSLVKTYIETELTNTKTVLLTEKVIKEYFNLTTQINEKFLIKNDFKLFEFNKYRLFFPSGSINPENELLLHVDIERHEITVYHSKGRSKFTTLTCFCNETDFTQELLSEIYYGLTRKNLKTLQYSTEIEYKTGMVLRKSGTLFIVVSPCNKDIKVTNLLSSKYETIMVNYDDLQHYDIVETTIFKNIQ